MFKDKIIFITGASSGIGAATAKEFAKHGAKLLLCARRIEKLQELANLIKAETNAVLHCFQLDVRNQSNVLNTLRNLPVEWKPIDILINNAGLAAGLDAFQDANINDWDEMIDTNVKGLLYVTREIIPGMIARNKGHIINIGSIAGHYVYPKGSVYCASKYAVKAISEGLRMDLFGTDVRVTSIDPGAVETNFSHVRFKGDITRASKVYEGMTPLSAEDIADTILFCASRPAHVNICDVIMTPTAQASATLVARK